MENKQLTINEQMEKAVQEMMSSSGFIVVNKKAVRIFGLEAAALLGEFVSKEKYLKEQGELTEDGYFYSTIADVENNTSVINHRPQRYKFIHPFLMGIVIGIDFPRSGKFTVQHII